MPSQRDWDQMLKAGLEMKTMAQKFIDFAHMYGAGKGGEGEEDLEEQDESGDEDALSEESDDEGKSGRLNRNPKAAIMIAIKKAKKENAKD